MLNNMTNNMTNTIKTINYRHQLFTVWTSKSFRYGAVEVSAEDFNHAFIQLSESDKSNLICICDERGNQKEAREFNA